LSLVLDGAHNLMNLDAQGVSLRAKNEVDNYIYLDAQGVLGSELDTWGIIMKKQRTASESRMKLTTEEKEERALFI